MHSMLKYTEFSDPCFLTFCESIRSGQDHAIMLKKLLELVWTYLGESLTKFQFAIGSPHPVLINHLYVSFEDIILSFIYII